MSDFLFARNLSKRYGSGSMVLSGLHHHFRKGSATGLIGANGSGKTTFLRLLSVISYPTDGTVTFQGQCIYEKPHWYLQYTGMVTDTMDLPAYLSAAELMEWTLRSRKKWDDEQSPARMDRIFEQLHFDERRNNLIGTYSSGMLQKTMLACSLITEPEILLMDEPFRALDQESCQAALDMLGSFKKNGGTLLISSHVQDTLARICDEYISFPVR